MKTGVSTVIIIGGGRAGIQAALEQSKAGKKVYIVERFPSISPLSTLDLAELRENSNIKIITNADVKAIEEKDGRFRIKIRKRASRVIDEKCNDCQDCIRICPVNLEDAYNDGLSLRTAIDFSSPVTGIYSIIKEDRPICQETCPVHLDIRGYIGLVADGKLNEALDLIRERLPLPGVIGRICPHPCEQQCNRGIQDCALAINALKRFVADYEVRTSGKPKAVIKAPRKDKVAIVGAGPAGLTCAHDLAIMGYQVTVFESLPVVGGMLYIGIPEYRLPKDILQREIDDIRNVGVEIKNNTPIGKDLSIDDLFQNGFKAVFIAVGAHQSMKLGVLGEEANGVVLGVDLLRDLNLGKKVKVGKKVVVIGGGNVAMDAARSAVRLGAKKVSILYRRTRQEMPASEEEIQAAEAEGIEITYLVAPAEVLSHNGKVAGIKSIRMKLGEPDASGRKRPVVIKGSEFDIDADMVIPAIGQITDISFLGKSSGIATTKGNTLLVSPETLATSRNGVFAGGDAVTGPATAIEAIAAGQKAATAIDQYLRRG
jgi:heterodisulfide reductase subunit A